jgi:hypothetical protein
MPTIFGLGSVVELQPVKLYVPLFGSTPYRTVKIGLSSGRLPRLS